MREGGRGRSANDVTQWAMKREETEEEVVGYKNMEGWIREGR